MKLSEFYLQEATRWESIEDGFKYQWLPRIKRLFGSFFDIRRRPVKHMVFTYIDYCKVMSDYALLRLEAR